MRRRRADVALQGHRAVSRIGAPDDPGRRARWLAAAMRRAYDLSWVPEHLVANITAIDVDREHEAVILTLRSGTQLVDRLDRIDVVGKPDDVAVGELAEAVRRRGWAAVTLRGSPEFRRAAALRLAALEPPIHVAGSPLMDMELIELERLRRLRQQDPAPGPEFDRLGSPVAAKERPLRICIPPESSPAWSTSRR